mmetsp:Transcript_18871/g.32480  ORF Transcript_18871/g.32480 Transcript_18871/m.32480 type:complete len:97 (-) Transcript_18871:117-407(-)
MTSVLLASGMHEHDMNLADPEGIHAPCTKFRATSMYVASGLWWSTLFSRFLMPELSLADPEGLSRNQAVVLTLFFGFSMPELQDEREFHALLRQIW